MVRAAGFEPATFGSGGQRSIQLSYARTLCHARSYNIQDISGCQEKCGKKDVRLPGCKTAALDFASRIQVRLYVKFKCTGTKDRHCGAAPGRNNGRKVYENDEHFFADRTDMHGNTGYCGRLQPKTGTGPEARRKSGCGQTGGAGTARSEKGRGSRGDKRDFSRG